MVHGTVLVDEHHALHHLDHLQADVQRDGDQVAVQHKAGHKAQQPQRRRLAWVKLQQNRIAGVTSDCRSLDELNSYSASQSCAGSIACCPGPTTSMRSAAHPSLQPDELQHCLLMTHPFLKLQSPDAESNGRSLAPQQARCISRPCTAAPGLQTALRCCHVDILSLRRTPPSSHLPSGCMPVEMWFKMQPLSP